MVKTNKKSLLITMLIVLFSAILLVGGLSLNTTKPQVDAQVKAETNTTLIGYLNKFGGENDSNSTSGNFWYKLLNYDITNLTITSDDSKVPQTYLEAPDVSLARDGSLKAYVVAGANNTYDCIIHGDVDVIYAPEDSYSLFKGNETNLSYLKTINFDNFNTSNVTDMNSMFSGCSGLTSLNLSNFNTSNVTDMKFMFSGCSSLTSLNISSFNTSNVTDMNSMFSGCSGLTSLNLSNFNTSNVTYMSHMFSRCSGLTSLNLSNFNTSNVISMWCMFENCSGLTSLNVSNFNTSNVTSMRVMFAHCSKLTSLNISSFDTSKVTEIDEMFFGCSSLTSLDLRSFNTNNVEDMRFMFSECSSLTSLDLRNFNTSKVQDMCAMFSYCSDLETLYLGSFDTSNVTDMESMFLNCSSLTQIDVSKFNTTNVTNFFGMFSGCSALQVLDLSSFDFSAVTSNNDMLGFIGINDTMVMGTLQSYGSAAEQLLTAYQQAIASPGVENRIAVVAVALENLFYLPAEDAQLTAQGLFNTNIQTIYAPVSVKGLNISLPYNNNATFVYNSGSGETETGFLIGRDTLQELAIYPQNTTPLEKPEINGPLTPATGFDMTDLAITTTLGFVVMIAVAVVFNNTKKKYSKK